MSQNKKISVIMSAHNSERFLSESIESILNQSLSDFEFIIVDDGSTDSSSTIIRRYAESDPRIIQIHRDQKGLTKSLNEALALARGAFIARQDADDISLPHRLNTMVNFLKANPSVSAAGAWCEIIDDTGRVMSHLRFPVDHDRICWMMIGSTPIVHPSAVIRQECFAQYGSYNEKYFYAQDYELWTRWIRLGARLANIPEILIKYRNSPNQISTKYFKPQSQNAADAATVYINFLLSDRLQPKEILGVRQLVAPWPVDANGIYGIPVLLRLLRLPRFRRSLRFAWTTRSSIAEKIAKVIRQFSGGDRRRPLSGLMVAILISPKVIVERNLWAGLANQIAFLVHKKIAN